MLGHERKRFEKVGKSPRSPRRQSSAVYLFLVGEDRWIERIKRRTEHLIVRIRPIRPGFCESEEVIEAAGGAGQGKTQARCKVSRMKDAKILFSATHEADSRCSSWLHEVHTSRSRGHALTVTRPHSSKRGSGRERDRHCTCDSLGV
jgi:hypothetical protein